MILMALTSHVAIAVPAMFLGGAAWITSANTLSVSIQMGLPNWVRARGMSTYQMGIMGASASGAAIWGQIATWTDLTVSLGIAAVTGTIAMALANRWMPDHGHTDDLTPQRVLTPTTTDDAPDQGRVCVTIEYPIDPAKPRNSAI
jgi:phosphate/sulfate permease